MALLHFPLDKGSLPSKAVLFALCHHAQTTFPALQLVKFYGRSKSQSCKGSHRSQCDSKTHLVAGGATTRVPGLRGALSTARVRSPGSRQPPRLTEDSVGSPLHTVSHLQGCCFLQRGEFFAWNFIWARFYEECISSGKL